MFFWDPNSQTFINVADNDKSVLISFQKQKAAQKRTKVVLKLFDTNRYAPGPHPFHYGGFTKRQFVTNDATDNILCYKFLNAYQLKSEAWVKSQTFHLRHHKNCNFDFFYIQYDPKKLKNKQRWREEDDDEITDHDDERERENEEEGNEHEKEHIKREEAAKKGDKKDCGCCCHDHDKKKRKKKEKSDAGEPDDTDDVTEIPWTHVKPKPPPVTGGGGKPPPQPTPEPPKPPPKEPGPGELNEEYGLIIEKPFYIISAIGENRYVDVVDERNVVIKTPNEYDSQKWYFDQKSKTIKNKMFNDKSLDITNSGRTNDMQIWSTNGGWF